MQGGSPGMQDLTKRSSCATPLPKKRREWRDSFPNTFSSKKRRLSYSTPERPQGSIAASNTAQTGRGATSRARPSTPSVFPSPYSRVIIVQGDRFIPTRRPFSLPLYASPRTVRIANVFGLADDRILSYNDPTLRTPESRMFQSLRTNVMQLFQQPKAIPSVSSLANLGVNKQFVLALDAPGVPSDILSFPLSWSASNKIAVACGCDVYYQDLDTREITHLCNTDPPIRVIDWAKQDSNVLALGAERGILHLWDAADSTLVRDWSDGKRIGVYSLSWHDEVLAVGERPGSIGLYDVRVPQTIAKLGGHKVPVYSLEWSPDGKYLASGDASGVVQIWDATACKTLGEGNKKGGRMRHGALVKVTSTPPPPTRLALTINSRHLRGVRGNQSF